MQNALPTQRTAHAVGAHAATRASVFARPRGGTHDIEERDTLADRSVLGQVDDFAELHSKQPRERLTDHSVYPRNLRTKHMSQAFSRSLWNGKHSESRCRTYWCASHCAQACSSACVRVRVSMSRMCVCTLVCRCDSSGRACLCNDLESIDDRKRPVQRETVGILTHAPTPCSAKTRDASEATTCSAIT
jgi:hypothetical protein